MAARAGGITRRRQGSPCPRPGRVSAGGGGSPEPRSNALPRGEGGVTVLRWPGTFLRAPAPLDIYPWRGGALCPVSVSLSLQLHGEEKVGCEKGPPRLSCSRPSPPRSGEARLCGSSAPGPALGHGWFQRLESGLSSPPPTGERGGSLHPRDVPATRPGPHPGPHLPFDGHGTPLLGGAGKALIGAPVPDRYHLLSDTGERLTLSGPRYHGEPG